MAHATANQLHTCTACRARHPPSLSRCSGEPEAQLRYPILPVSVSQHGVRKNSTSPSSYREIDPNDVVRIEWRKQPEIIQMRRAMGGFSLFFVLPIPSHAEAESRAHALAACSLRKVAPGGLWLRASRRCTWRRASVEIGSACDEKKGPVARNTRRELDAKARCQQATAVGGERREAGGESRTRRFICASPDPPLLQADGDEGLQMRLCGWSMLRALHR